MNNLNLKIEDNTLIIALSGRIDSVNAAEIGGEIDAHITAVPHNDVIIDAENLEYISSAGLRILLRIRKNAKKMQIVNASHEVYDILEMTGFTEMMPVKKAYRKISVDGCDVIGTGATGTVYRLDDDIIVKVYNEGYSVGDIHRERELAKKAFVRGIPTAIPFDVVKVGDSYGSVFELLRAKSLAELIAENPADTDRYINLSSELMKTIHSITAQEGELPSVKENALAVADYMSAFLPAEKSEKFKRMTEEIPDCLNTVHGDLHIKNLMMQNGELVLIDMDTLCHGHPIFEFAPLYNAYLGYSEVDKNNTLEFFGIPYETGERICRETLKRYLGDDGERFRQAEDKIRLMGYAFLYRDFTSSGMPEGNDRLCADAYLNYINTLLDRVDSFIF